MLKLYGFPLSNYHNKVKLALLEKNVPFEEVIVHFREGEGQREMSPLEKVPYIETEQGHMCESQVILDYIEAQWPTPALLPADPWQAAKLREIIQFMELHVELCVRQIYPQAYFGGTLPEKFLARVRTDLERNLAAFKQLAVFAPYIGGADFTMADCAGYVHLPVAALATKLVYGEDLVLAAGIDWKPYVKLIEQRATAQKVAADRKADQERAIAAAKAKFGTA